MKKIPFLVQLYFIVCIVLFVPLIFLIKNNTYNVLKYSENEIASSALENLISIQTLNDTILQNVKRETTNLAKDSNIANISDIKLLFSSDTVSNFARLKSVEQLINQTVYTDDKIFSVYIYIDGADYIISSRQGMVLLSEFADRDLISQYQSGKYAAFGGTWQPRYISDSGQTVNSISYIYPLTSITSTARGVIIINLYENRFSNLMNASGLTDKGSTFIIDTNGNIITHGSNNSFMQNLYASPSIANIIQSQSSSGSMIFSEEDGKVLYVYYKDSLKGWVYVSCYSFNMLMEKINTINNTSLILLIVCIVCGILITFFVVLHMSKPLTALVNSLRKREDLKLGNAKNEMVILSSAFQQIAQQEKNLNNILQKKEEDANELFINDLLKGNTSKYLEEIDNQKPVFPYPNFIVLVVSIDHTELFISEYTPEQRYYYKVMMLSKYRTVFNQSYIAKGVPCEGQTIAVILNIKEYDCKSTPSTIKNYLLQLQNEIKQEYKLTTSIGVGGIHNNLSGIRSSFSEAEEALKQRICTGYESVLFWKEKFTENGRYFYPYNREKHIINCIQARNKDTLIEEIHLIVQDMKNAEGISYDNIIQIFNQLISSTIKYLVENSININSLFGSIYEIYHKMAGVETLDDIENYMLSFYKKIMDYIIDHNLSKEERHIDKIVNYINANYTHEIDFEDMAENIGISYSYIRKIIKDETGKNLIDYINVLRIKKAKEILRQTDLSLANVAKAVGYNNDQSFTRFFKKYEGITPGDYRNLK